MSTSLTPKLAEMYFNEVKFQTNPDINILYQLLEYGKYPVGYYEKDAICLKIQALNHEPTLLEKNMTTQQLYDANNNYWANQYEIAALTQYLYLLDNIPADEAFRAITNYHLNLRFK